MEKDIYVALDLGNENSRIVYYNKYSNCPVDVLVNSENQTTSFPNTITVNDEGVYYGNVIDKDESRENSEVIDLKDLLYTDKYKNDVDLLAGFIEELLLLLDLDNYREDIKLLGITLVDLNKEVIDKIYKALVKLKLNKEKIKKISHDQSFFNYIMGISADRTILSTGLYEFENSKLSFKKLHYNQLNGKYFVDVVKIKEIFLSNNKENWDNEFLQFIMDSYGVENYNSIQITGRDFDTNWAKKSIKALLLRQRRICYGENLYATGALFSVIPQKVSPKYIYTSKDTTINSLFINYKKNSNKDEKYCVLPAGGNWYDYKVNLELILSEEKKITLYNYNIVTCKYEEIEIPLYMLPKRGELSTIIELEIKFLNNKNINIKVIDKGLGKFFKGLGEIQNIDFVVS